MELHDLVLAARAHPYASAASAAILYIVLLKTASLLSNIRYARSTGLNYIIYPYGPGGNFSDVFLGTGPSTGQRLVRYLPKDWQDYFHNSAFGSHWMVQGRMARKHGSVYLGVSPAANMHGVVCYISDAAVITQVLTDSAMFPKPLDVYGGAPHDLIPRNSGS